MDDPEVRQPIAVVNYVALLCAAVAAMVYLKIVLISAIIGVGIGVLLTPPLRRLQKRFHVSKAAGAALIVMLALAALAGLAWGVFAITEPQIQSLAERMPQITEKLQNLFNGLVSRYPWIGSSVQSFNVGDAAKSVGGKLFSSAWSGMAMLGGLAFAFIIGLYTAVESGGYYRGLLRAFPAESRERAAAFLEEAASTVRNWFRAQLTDMAIIGALTGIGLWIAGTDYWLVFGLLTGLLGIIPYAGIAIVVTFAGLVTLASAPDRLPWVLGVFAVTQQLEGHLILPMVMSGRADLPAVPLLIFMLVVGAWGGLLGVLMAPPLFAVLLLAYRRFYLPRMGPDEDEAQAAAA